MHKIKYYKQQRTQEKKNGIDEKQRPRSCAIDVLEENIISFLSRV